MAVRQTKNNKSNTNKKLLDSILNKEPAHPKLNGQVKKKKKAAFKRALILHGKTLTFLRL